MFISFTLWGDSFHINVWVWRDLSLVSFPLKKTWISFLPMCRKQVLNHYIVRCTLGFLPLVSILKWTVFHCHMALEYVASDVFIWLISNIPLRLCFVFNMIKLSPQISLSVCCAWSSISKLAGFYCLEDQHHTEGNEKDVCIQSQQLLILL